MAQRRAAPVASGTTGVRLPGTEMYAAELQRARDRMSMQRALAELQQRQEALNIEKSRIKLAERQAAERERAQKEIERKAQQRERQTAAKQQELAKRPLSGAGRGPGAAASAAGAAPPAAAPTPGVAPTPPATPTAAPPPTPSPVPPAAPTPGPTPTPAPTPPTTAPAAPGAPSQAIQAEVSRRTQEARAAYQEAIEVAKTPAQTVAARNTLRKALDGVREWEKTQRAEVAEAQEEAALEGKLVQGRQELTRAFLARGPAGLQAAWRQMLSSQPRLGSDAIKTLRSTYDDLRQQGVSDAKASKARTDAQVAGWNTDFTKRYDRIVRTYRKPPAPGSLEAKLTGALGIDRRARAETDIVEAFLAQRTSARNASTDLQQEMNALAEKEYAAALRKLGPAPPASARDLSREAAATLQQAIAAVKTPQALEAAKDDILFKFLKRAVDLKTRQAQRDYLVVKSMLSAPLSEALPGQPEAWQRNLMTPPPPPETGVQ